MKNKLSILIGPLLLWACSGDPGKQGITGNLGPQSQQAADAISGNEGIVENGNTAHPDHIASSDGVGKDGTDSSVGASPTPKTDIPPVVSAPETDGEETSVTPPAKITGAFLVGEVIASAEGETGPLKIGIVAKQNDVRLANDPDRYDLNWRLAADEELESSLRLLPTKDPAYDRILEFDGSMEELEMFSEKFSVQLMVAEDMGATKLESVVKSSLNDLFEPIPAE